MDAKTSLSSSNSVHLFVFFRYEAEGRYRKKVKAQKLWFAILDSQIETGTPYMLYKDACNRKSNQKVTPLFMSRLLVCKKYVNGFFFAFHYRTLGQSNVVTFVRRLWNTPVLMR